MYRVQIQRIFTCKYSFNYLIIINDKKNKTLK